MELTGQIIQSTGSWYKVACEDRTYDARLPGKFRLMDRTQTNPVAVGDEVKIELLDDEAARITEILPRRNKIARKATHGKKGEHVIAANIDTAIVVVSIAEPVYRTGFIDRFLATCELFDVLPVITFNKIDLLSRDDRESFESVAFVYRNLGYTVVTCSIKKTETLEPLKGLLQNHVSLLTGPSGVGKTSILNTIEKKSARPVAPVSEYSGKGKHTTTFAELIPLHFGGYLIDTPGIREFGLVGVAPDELSLLFPDIDEYQEKCRYYNCSHTHEPGCAVKEAVSNGVIASFRYKNYIQIYKSFEDERR
ncbi:MAG TPA: ribosome small subunit-dependent GTPase A [Balneolales bacterium]|nr:ribosome small subunit-dependent GTPase A [Balneolales bacterium]